MNRRHVNLVRSPQIILPLILWQAVRPILEQEVSNVPHYLTSSSTHYLKYKHYISLWMVPRSLPGERVIDTALEEFTQNSRGCRPICYTSTKRTCENHHVNTHKESSGREATTEMEMATNQITWKQGQTSCSTTETALDSTWWERRKFAKYLEDLSLKAETKYSFWRATMNLKRPQIKIPPIRKENGSWARSDEEKALVFANHLEEVFTPNPPQGTQPILT